MIPLGVLASARHAVAPAGTPPPVSAYRAWWDFSDTASLSIVSGEIQTAADKSGNGWTLTAASSARRPSSATSALLGGSSLPCAVFTDDFDVPNAGDRLATATAPVTGDFTVIMAAAKATAGATGNSDGLIDINGLSVFVYNPGGGEVLSIWTGTGVGDVSSTSSDWTNAAVWTRALSSTSHFVWRGTTNKIDAAAGNSGTPAPLILGSGGAATDGSDFVIGEVVLYPSALSQTDRESMVAYLSAKWGIA